MRDVGANKYLLAEEVRRHLTVLERELLDAADRGEPLTHREARLLVENAELRLEPVERALRYEARTPRQRLRTWLAPRIGQLTHYAPRPLILPRSYFQPVRCSRELPTVSIVTPSFQQCAFLARTMGSVIGQGYPALEYVVQDGGSSDGSVDVIRSHSNLLFCWASEPDDGQADAINRGFAPTSGEIMAYLNSDDVLLPGALQYVGAFFAQHPEVDVVYGDRIMLDEHDREVGRWILPRHDDRVLRVADFVPQETLFWRRRIWEAAGGRVDTSFSYALDWDLLLRFQNAGAHMVHLPRFLGAFRIHETQKTTAALPIGMEEVALLRERAHDAPISPEEISDVLRRYFLRHRVRHLMHRLVDRFGPSGQPVTGFELDGALLDAAPAEPLAIEQHLR
jgi:glycosyltransferase involved in cell wall biosynthesis